MWNPKRAFVKCRERLYSPADALPYTRRDADGGIAVGLDEPCAAEGEADYAVGVFWGRAGRKATYGFPNGRWLAEGLREMDTADPAADLNAGNVEDVGSSVDRLNLLLRMAEYLGAHVRWAEGLNRGTHEPAIRRKTRWGRSPYHVGLRN